MPRQALGMGGYQMPADVAAADARARAANPHLFTQTSAPGWAPGPQQQQAYNYYLGLGNQLYSNPGFRSMSVGPGATPDAFARDALEFGLDRAVNRFSYGGNNLRGGGWQYQTPAADVLRGGGFTGRLPFADYLKQYSALGAGQPGVTVGDTRVQYAAGYGPGGLDPRLQRGPTDQYTFELPNLQPEIDAIKSLAQDVRNSNKPRGQQPLPAPGSNVPQGPTMQPFGLANYSAAGSGGAQPFFAAPLNRRAIRR